MPIDAEVRGQLARRFEVLLPHLNERQQRLALATEARLLRAHTDRRIKFTLPGPMTIVDTVADRFYGDRVTMAMAFAELLNEEALALQAGPLSDAKARQQVVAEGTKVAKLEAEQAEQRLYVEVRKPADARAYEQRTLAEADRDATLLAAEAEAEHARIVGLAEAEAIEARRAASPAGGG